MPATVRRLNDALETLARIVLCALLAAMVVVVTIQIGARSLSTSAIWTTEITQYLLLWLTFLGMAVVYRNGGHIGIELCVDMLSSGPRHFMRRVIHFVMAGFFLVIVIVAFDFTWTIRFSRAATIDISMVWPYSALVVGSLLGFVFATEQVLFPDEPTSPESQV